MIKWLAVAVAAPLFAVSPAHAQMKSLVPSDVANVARARTIDLRILQQRGFERPLLLVQGMIARKDVADNAFVGLGLADMYTRRKRGLTGRPDEGLKRSKKPALTFVMKF